MDAPPDFVASAASSTEAAAFQRPNVIYRARPVDKRDARAVRFLLHDGVPGRPRDHLVGHVLETRDKLDLHADAAERTLGARREDHDHVHPEDCA